MLFKRISWILIFVSTIILFCSSCSKLDDHTKNHRSIDYSFFVAGHVYGTPGSKYQVGVHPPFKSAFNHIRDKSLDFGVFAGDSVIGSQKKRYDALKSDIKLLNMPIHVVPGNHEVGTIRELKAFEDSFPQRYYFWQTGNDLHFVLDSVQNGWNIEGEQLELLKSNLATHSSVKNVFIYVHNIIWWYETADKEKLWPNSHSGKAEKSTFWTQLAPLLNKSKKEIYIFAGDVGAFSNRPAAYHEEIENIQFITTGMGGMKNDNFVIVHVYNDNSVEFELFALNGDDPNRLGALEDH